MPVATLGNRVAAQSMPRIAYRYFRLQRCFRMFVFLFLQLSLFLQTSSPAELRTFVRDSSGSKHRLSRSGRMLLQARSDVGSDAGSSFFFKKKIVRGCTSKTAENYDVKLKANQDDGSCIEPTPRDIADDGRYKFYRSDLDEESPFFVDPALRRIWRNGRFDRGGTMTVHDVDMTSQEKLRYGLEDANGAAAAGGNSHGPHLVLPVGEPIPQSLDDRLRLAELDRTERAALRDVAGPGASTPADTSAAAASHDAGSEVPMTVMGMPADIWPNPINVPAYTSVPV